jgi:hypothetical protein
MTRYESDLILKRIEVNLVKMREELVNSSSPVKIRILEAKIDKLQDDYDYWYSKDSDDEYWY